MSRSNSVKPHVIDLLSDGKARTYTDILLALGDKFPEMASDEKFGTRVHNALSYGVNHGYIKKVGWKGYTLPQRDLFLPKNKGEELLEIFVGNQGAADFIQKIPDEYRGTSLAILAKWLEVVEFFQEITPDKAEAIERGGISHQADVVISDMNLLTYFGRMILRGEEIPDK